MLKCPRSKVIVWVCKSHQFFHTIYCTIPESDMNSTLWNIGYYSVWAPFLMNRQEIVQQLFGSWWKLMTTQPGPLPFAAFAKEGVSVTSAKLEVQILSDSSWWCLQCFDQSSEQKSDSQLRPGNELPCGLLSIPGLGALDESSFSIRSLKSWTFQWAFQITRRT